MRCYVPQTQTSWLTLHEQRETRFLLYKISSVTDRKEMLKKPFPDKELKQYSTEELFLLKIFSFNKLDGYGLKLLYIYLLIPG